MTRYREIAGDAAALAAGPLEADESSFRVTHRLSDDAYRRLAEHLAPRPDAWLHLDWNVSPDLSALRHFAGLRHLMVTDLRLESWDGLRYVADSLEDLTMGETTLRPRSIAPMSQLTSLRSLGLVGPVRNVETLASLTGLEELSLRSVTLPDLSLLTPMRKLRSLWIGLGGTSDLSLLTELPALEDLELWRIRGLRDVSMLGALARLQRLHLQAMTAITELPSLRHDASLRRVALDTMKGITDLAPVADAPALEELLLVAMPQLSPESLRPLIGHPTLRHGIWGLGSKRKNVAAYELLPLGDPPYGHPDLAP